MLQTDPGCEPGPRTGLRFWNFALHLSDLHADMLTTRPRRIIISASDVLSAGPRLNLPPGSPPLT